MVKGRGSMALAGPHLVKAVTGEDVTQEELGGSRVHCRRSGVADLEVGSDEECIDAIKCYLAFLPSHSEEAPPLRPASDPAGAPTTTCSTSCRNRTASPTTCTRSSAGSSTTATGST